MFTVAAGWMPSRRCNDDSGKSRAVVEWAILLAHPIIIPIGRAIRLGGITFLVRQRKCFLKRAELNLYVI